MFHYILNGDQRVDLRTVQYLLSYTYATDVSAFPGYTLFVLVATAFCFPITIWLLSHVELSKTFGPFLANKVRSKEEDCRPQAKRHYKV